MRDNDAQYGKTNVYFAYTTTQHPRNVAMSRVRIMRVVVIALLLLVADGASRAADWPQWLGPKRNGGTTEKVVPWKKAPKVLWQVSVGQGFSSPVAASGLVFLHARGPDKDKEEETVVAFDAATGKELWKDTYERPPYKSVLGTGPRATPTVAGKRLFTLGINGLLGCYEVATGKRFWQVNLYKQLQADLPRFAVCCSPLAIGNRVIVSVGGKGRCVVALNFETGKVEWQALDDAASTSSAILFAGGARPRGGAPDAVFMTPLRIVGLDPLDGSLRWEHPMVFQPQGTSPTPIVIGDKIVASTQAHGAVAVQVGKKDEGLAASAAWQNKEAKSYFSSGVTAGDLVVLVTNTAKPIPKAFLTCLEAKTGKELWKKKVGYFHAGVIRTGDDRLLVLSDSGELTLWEIDAQGAKELARAKVCEGTLVAPALAGGRLYVRDGKKIACVQLK
ncbi:MAG TPA: PQQ-binding-like beta-propeller repeat protein [Gemmataceae bacterium]|nr:PQQ-binding-like beta-propeller repeat protein [Gemmataceae bacterium]